MGAMQEVRALLASGASSGQAIAKGYAPGTVYKVQRQLRRAGQGPTTGPARNGALAQQPGAPSGNESEGAPALRERVAELEVKVAEAEETRQILLARTYNLGWANVDSETWEAIWKGPSPADSLATLVHWLEVEAHEMGERAEKAEAALKKEQTAHAEAERQAEELGQQSADKLKGLEATLRNSADAHLKARQAATWTERQLEDEKVARVKAEQQWQLWADKAAEFEQANQGLTRIVMELEPLRAWAGHPCKVCKKPMSGVVDRELAAKLQEELAHVTCIKKGGTPWVPLAIGGAILYGLTRK
ncbi:MAG: hypothetical protein HY688_00745 [Chloroflexi bacterium]|nr:hypothetical protein [Chloroflexota bacterium]